MSFFACSVFYSNGRAYFANLFVCEDGLVQENVDKVYRGKWGYEKVHNVPVLYKKCNKSVFVFICCCCSFLFIYPTFVAQIL